MAKGRPDRGWTTFRKKLDLPEDATPFEILSVNGGTRVTDAYEVFPKTRKGRRWLFLPVASSCTVGNV